MNMDGSQARSVRAHGARGQQHGSEATFSAGNPVQIAPNAPEYDPRLNARTRDGFHLQANNRNMTGQSVFAGQHFPQSSGPVPPGSQPLPEIRTYPQYRQVQMQSVNVQQRGSAQYPETGGYVSQVYESSPSQSVGHVMNGQIQQAYPSGAVNLPERRTGNPHSHAMSYSQMPGISSQAVAFPRMDIANIRPPLTAAVPNLDSMISGGRHLGNNTPNLASSSAGLGQSSSKLPGLRSPPYGQLRSIEQIARDPLPVKRVFNSERLPIPIMPRNVAAVPGHGPPSQLHSNPQMQHGSIGQVRGLQSSTQRQVYPGSMPSYNSVVERGSVAQAAEPRVGQPVSAYQYAGSARGNVSSASSLPPSTGQENNMSISAAKPSSTGERIQPFVRLATENHGASSSGIDNPYAVNRAASDPNVPATSAITFNANHIGFHGPDLNGITSVATGPGVQRLDAHNSETPRPPFMNLNRSYPGPKDGNTNPGSLNPVGYFPSVTGPSPKPQSGQVSLEREDHRVSPAHPAANDKDDEEVLDGGDGGQDITTKFKHLRDSSDKTSKIARDSAPPEVQKRPRAEPKSHVGNINNHGLLRHMALQPGINRSMFYIGQLFTRFCWHTEDAFLNSVSYLHHGSATKVWYTIPPKFAEKVAQYAEKEVFSESLMEGKVYAGTQLLMGKTTMIDPWSLRNAGIPVYRIVHKPGSFVVTAPRGYHAGFNCGFNIAEAVNYAGTNWLPFGREASRLARSIKRHLSIPREQLMYCAASALKNEVGRVGIAEVRKDPRSVDSARTLALELGLLLKEGEAAITKYAKSSGCRVMLMSEARTSVVNTEMNEDLSLGCYCSYCAHLAFFYAAVCGSCTRNEDARCQYHFGRAGKICTKPGHKVIVIRRHRPLFLLDLLELLESVAGMEVAPEAMLARYKFLRSWDTPMKESGIRFRLPLAEA